MLPPAKTYAGEQTRIGRQKPFADVLAFVRVPAFDCRPSRCAWRCPALIGRVLLHPVFIVLLQVQKTD
jgi:hypothetical protein